MHKIFFLVVLLSKSILVLSEFTNRSNFELDVSHSLIPPFNGTFENNWLALGDVSFEKEDTIILTPLKSSKWGSFFNRIPISSDSWKLNLHYTAFNSRSNDDNKIADGIALWFVPESEWRNKTTHHAYGGPSQNFTGLMIAIDNYRISSNFSLNRTSDEAAVVVVHNEHPRIYNWEDEGHDIALGRCLVRNRYENKTNNLETLSVEYVDDVLKVYHTFIPGLSHILKLCVEVRGLQIPSGYLLGVSAANGGIRGAYEVHALQFYSKKLDTIQHKIGSEDYNSSEESDYVSTIIGAKSVESPFSNFKIDLSNFELDVSHSLIPPFNQKLEENWLPRNIDFGKKDTIVLTILKGDDSGSIFNRIPISSDSWKLKLHYSAFNSRSNDDNQIADGIALWFLPESQQNNRTHHAYGGPSQNFTGLMIAMDNYRISSNLSLKRESDEAAVVVVHNEYPRLYNWEDEGHDIALGRCVVRNRYKNITNTLATLVVEYVDDILKVYHTNPNQKHRDLELCVEQHDMHIPSGYLLGVSAANGGIKGAYEVHSLLFYNKKLDNFTLPYTVKQVPWNTSTPPYPTPVLSKSNRIDLTDCSDSNEDSDSEESMGTTTQETLISDESSFTPTDDITKEKLALQAESVPASDYVSKLWSIIAGKPVESILGLSKSVQVFSNFTIDEPNFKLDWAISLKKGGKEQKVEKTKEKTRKKRTTVKEDYREPVRMESNIVHQNQPRMQPVTVSSDYLEFEPEIDQVKNEYSYILPSLYLSNLE